MITIEQAQQLVAEGAQCLLREYGQLRVEQMSLLEFLAAARSMADRALSGDEGIVWDDRSGRREGRFLRLSGLMLLALQQHGNSLYTTYALQRSLHGDKAQQKALLMESQFLRAEARDAFKTCHEQAKTSEFFEPEPWRKLKAIMERMGAEM